MTFLAIAVTAVRFTITVRFTDNLNAADRLPIKMGQTIRGE